MTKDTHLVKPYGVGKNKSSLAFVIPNEIVKEKKIDPGNTYFILKVIDNNNLSIKIVNVDEFE